MERSLLLGCGHNHSKQLQWGGKAEWAGELTKVDLYPESGADVVFDMDDLALRGIPLPFPDDTFDEIGAFNCIEHWGRQGDFRGWFREMAEYHRILKPGGLMFIVVPVGDDALADPGHTRFFQGNYFGFLSQAFYELNAIKQTCFSDYRWIWKLNFDLLYLKEHGHHLAAVLRKA